MWPGGERDVNTAVRAAAPLIAEPRDARAPPRPIVVGGIALAGLAAAAASFELSLGGDFGRAPQVQAALVAWITVSYVLCGLIAWLRRPESRFGPLMIAAGFAPALSRLAEADLQALHVFGEGLLLLPPVVFLHLFLAYPTGRLEGKLDLCVVAVGYLAVFCLSLVRLGLEVAGLSGGANGVLTAQRVVVAAVVLGALGALVSRRRASGRPLRLSLELLVACFVLAMVGLAVGIVMGSSRFPGGTRCGGSHLAWSGSRRCSS